MQKIKIHRQTCVRGSRQRGGGGGGGIASRGRFVPVFLLGNKGNNLWFSRGGQDPFPPSVSAHVRVSNRLNSHFIYFISKTYLLGLVNIHKTSANYKAKTAWFFLRENVHDTLSLAVCPVCRTYKQWPRSEFWGVWTGPPLFGLSKFK